MAIIEPYDILANWPGWQTSFDPMERAEISRQRNGVTRTKLGPMPLWTMQAVSVSLSPNEHDALKAIVQRLEGLQSVILGYSLSRCFPIAYPNGTWPTGGAFNGMTAIVDSVDALTNRSLRLSSLPAGYQGRAGDMIQIGASNLHRVAEPFVASGAGLTGLFEVNPPFWPGIAPGQLVSVKRPACNMRIAVGSVSAPIDPTTGRGTVSFSAVEARDA